MSSHTLDRRFGITAVDLDLITEEQLIEATAIQIREELGSRRHRPIGQILMASGHLDAAQVEAVFRAMGLHPGLLHPAATPPPSPAASCTPRQKTKA